MSGPWGFLCSLIRPGARAFAAAAALQFAAVASGIGLMATSAWLIATAGLHPSIAVLGVAVVGVRFFGLARGILRYLERLASHGATLSLLSRLRVTIYTALVPLAPSRLAGERSGDLVSRLVNDVEDLGTIYVRVLGPSVAAALVAMLVCALLVPRGAALAMAALAGLAAAGVAIPLAALSIAAPFSARTVAARADVAARATDAFQGLADLLAFGRGGDFREDLSRRSRDLVAAQARTVRVSAAASAAAAFAGDVSALAVFALGVPMVRSGALDGVQFTVAVLVTLAAFEVAAPLAAAWPHLGATRAAASRIHALVDGVPAVAEPASPVSSPEGRRLDVRSLSFRYPGQDRDTLRDVSFTMTPGRCVAILGPSGAGKSTIAALLLRFYDATAGSIVLDDHDVREYGAEAVRRCLSYADQRASILTGTVRENLQLARAGADDAALVEALELAGLADRVRSMPAGLDTWIGEQGQQLSGGERQRLALARAILKPSPFLILDEPGANLDPIAERHTRSTVRRLAQDRGVLLITHRAVGLDFASEILVLHDGRVSQRGTFAALRSQDGWFRRMLDLQRSAAALEEPAERGGPPSTLPA